MKTSLKHAIVVGARLLILLLILPGEAPAAVSDLRSPAPAPVRSDSRETRAVALSPSASSEKDSNGKGTLEEQLRLLLEELKRLEKDAEEKFRKDILPYLKREIEKLRNRLKEFSPGKEEAPQPRRVRT